MQMDLENVFLTIAPLHRAGLRSHGNGSRLCFSPGLTQVQVVINCCSSHKYALNWAHWLTFSGEVGPGPHLGPFSYSFTDI